MFITLFVIWSMAQVLAQLLLDLDVAVATVTARADGRMASSLRFAFLALSFGLPVMYKLSTHILPRSIPKSMFDRNVPGNSYAALLVKLQLTRKSLYADIKMWRCFACLVYEHMLHPTLL